MEIYNDQSRDLLGSFEDGMSNEVAACPRGAMQAAARGCVERRADLSVYLSIYLSIEIDVEIYVYVYASSVHAVCRNRAVGEARRSGLWRHPCAPERVAALSDGSGECALQYSRSLA